MNGGEESKFGKKERSKIRSLICILPNVSRQTPTVLNASAYEQSILQIPQVPCLFRCIFPVSRKGLFHHGPANSLPDLNTSGCEKPVSENSRQILPTI